MSGVCFLCEILIELLITPYRYFPIQKPIWSLKIFFPFNRITSIEVDGYQTDTPTPVPGTNSDYEIIFSFTPDEETTHTICVVAVEEER